MLQPRIFTVLCAFDTKRMQKFLRSMADIRWLLAVTLESVPFVNEFTTITLVFAQIAQRWYWPFFLNFNMEFIVCPASEAKECTTMTVNKRY